jgi:hypothetical protein
LFTGLSDSYTLFKDETTFINNNASLISKHFSDHFGNRRPFTFVSLGCGPHNSIVFKDLPLLQAVGASSYVAMDCNEDFAKAAAEGVQKKEPTIKSSWLCDDFTKPFKLKGIPKNNLVVLSLLGATLGQHPFNGSENPSFDGISLQKLLTNLGESTRYDAVLLATIDAEMDKETLESKYGGKGMRKLMNTFWKTAKEVAGDPMFNDEAFHYYPEVDMNNPESPNVKFVHFANKQTSICINDTCYTIPQGTEFVIGCSQKATPSVILPYCYEVGWNCVPKMRLNYMNSVRMIGLTGKNIINKGSEYSRA